MTEVPAGSGPQKGDTYVPYRTRFTYEGVEYTAWLFTDYSWAEMDFVEQVTGLTYEELLDPRISQYSRVTAASAFTSINRRRQEDLDAGRKSALPLLQWDDFRRGQMREVKVVPRPVPTADPEPVKAPDTLPIESPANPRPNAPMYERFSEDPTVAEPDGSASTSATSEPNTSESSPPSSGSDPGNGDG